MRKSRKLTDSIRKQKKYNVSKSQLKTHEIRMEVENIDPVELEKLNKHKGKIFIWSFTLSRRKPNDHTTEARISTHNYVPKHKLIPRIKRAFPEECKIKLVGNYSFTHAFDLKLNTPMRYDLIHIKVIQALEDIL